MEMEKALPQLNNSFKIPHRFFKSLQQDPKTNTKQTSEPLLTLNAYRLFISGLLVLVPKWSPSLLLQTPLNPDLYEVVSMGYLLLTLIFFIGIQRNIPSLKHQITTHLLVDILVLSTLMHQLGSVQSGVGILLFVPVAGSGIIVPGRMPLVFAALASIALLAEQVICHLFLGAHPEHFMMTGFLGASYLISAFFTSNLAKHIKTQEKITEQQNANIAELQQLNAHIIHHMRAGVLVLTNEDELRLMNESAWYMLDMPNTKSHSLKECAPRLLDELSSWKLNHKKKSNPFKTAVTGPELIAEFNTLDTPSGQANTLIFLNDRSQMTQEAQQLKLASLGRLTASIAHEIRNPLGAIRHAAQLLQESPNVTENDIYLMKIIDKHTGRINNIVENVLQLSRRKPALQEKIYLKEWLGSFVNELLQSQPQACKIVTHIDPPDTCVQFDISQLHQIVANLCENGLRYSLAERGQASLQILGGITKESGGPFLDIIDQGPGIASDQLEKIFEPFYTTETSGTGLGLHIARELCEINQAQLDYLPLPTQGSCFRIRFPYPRKVII